MRSKPMSFAIFTAARIPHKDGTFELPNVPPGEYTVVGWHERVGEQRARVRVERGKAATVDLSLPVEDPQ